MERSSMMVAPLWDGRNMSFTGSFSSFQQGRNVPRRICVEKTAGDAFRMIAEPRLISPNFALDIQICFGMSRVCENTIHPAFCRIGSLTF